MYETGGLPHFDYPLVQNPVNEKNFYIGTWSVKKSNNNGDNWTNYKNPSFDGYITDIAISKTDTTHFMLSSFRHWVDDYGNPPGGSLDKLDPVNQNVINISDNINLVANTPQLIHNARITSIEFHPTNANIVWITFGNFADKDKVFQTLDYGETWQNISHDLPNIPVNTVAYDDQLDQLYIGTDVGVFYLDNPTDITFDQTWERYGDFPLVIASDIKINHTSREIVVATYGRGVWRADLACACNNIPEQITENQTWNNSRSITNDIEILENGKLTINSDAYIKFAPDAKIIVKPGGELIISGGKLTNSCGEMWQGIIVEGNGELSQYPTENQGYVGLNNATIENAQIGIHSQKGGIIIVNNSNFTDNYTDIQIEEYKYANNNRSYIKNCNFSTTENYYNYHFNKTNHVYLRNLNKVTLSGNNFAYNGNNEIPISFRGTGIRALNSDVAIVAGCSDFIEPCPETNQLPNSFKDLYYGISIGGTGISNSIKIDNNDFINCQKSILVGSASPVITRNTVDVPQANGIYHPVGIYLNNCTGYQVEENKIFSTAIANNVGLVVRNSGEAANEIYKNEFKSLNIACEAQGNNGTRQTKGGLQFLCNEFTNIGTSIFVTEYTPTTNDTIIIVPDPMRDEPVYGISEYQGGKTLPAQNTFVNTEHDLTNQQAQFYYFYNPFGSNSIPTGNQNVSLQQTTSINECPSHLNNTIPIETLSLLSDSILETETKLVALLDEGETEATVHEIQTANNSDANKLRRSLLQISPTLSDTSLVSTVVIEEVLPPVMLAEILSANPRSAKSDKVLNAISQRTHPLPPPFIDEIMKGQDTVSEREILAAKLNRQHNQRTRLLNQKTRELSNDTVSATAPQELISFLQQENSLSADYRLVDFYLRLQDADNAQNTLSQIPSKYELTVNQQSEHQLTTQLTAIQCELIRNGKTYAQMDNIQKQALYIIAENDKYQAGTSAQNIISMIDGTEFYKGVVIPQYQIVQKSSEATQTPIFKFGLSPNPATDYFVVDYDLGIRNFTQSQFLMFNSNNQKVLAMPITKPVYQLLIETEKYPAGIYTCKIFANNEQLSEKQITIKVEKLNKNEEILNNLDIFAVYPNPAKDYITINYNISNANKSVIIITDNTGKIVKTQELTKNSNQTKITTTDLSNGTYNISLQSDNKTIKTQTIVINK